MTMVKIGEVHGNFRIIEKLNRKFKDGSYLFKMKCEECNTEIERISSNITRHPATCICKRKFAYGQAAFNKLFNYYKSQSKTRGHSFDLSKEWFKNLTSRDCFYCGSKPYAEYKGTRTFGNYIYNGLDRLDNDKGYELDNVVPCCQQCNKAKLDMNILEFKSWIKRLINHNKDFIKYQNETTVISSRSYLDYKKGE